MKRLLISWIVLFSNVAGARAPFQSVAQVCQGRRPIEIAHGTASLESFWAGFRADWKTSDAAVYRLTDLPGVYVAIFPTLATMNSVLGRPTVYLTEGGRIVTHHDAEKGAVFSGYVGHDLKEKLLREFSRAFVMAEKSMAVPSTPPASICLEASFWKKFLWPRMQREKGLILIAAASEYRLKSTVSHEILHAVFYRSLKIRRLTEEFWETRMSEADRRSIIGKLAAYKYDVPANRELLLNEFFAYLLQSGSGEDLLEGHARKYRALLRRHLQDNGVFLPGI